MAENEKRYVLVEVWELEEFSTVGPTTRSGSNDPRARLSISHIRAIAMADVVLAVAPNGSATLVFDADIENQEYGPGNQAHVLTIHARPERMA